MFESMKMATFNGVPIAIYGLSGITLVLLTLLTFKADVFTPKKKTDVEEKKADVEEKRPYSEENKSALAPEAKVKEVPPIAEVVGMEKNAFGGKRNKNRTKSKRNREKRHNKTKSKRIKH